MIAITHADIHREFDSQMLAILPKLGLTQSDVAWPNMRFTPNPKHGYLRLYNLPGVGGARTLGPHCFVELLGIYQVSILQPLNTGCAIAEQQASIILNEFPLGRVLHCCGQEIIITNAYSSRAIEEENRFHLPVSLVYECYVPQKQNGA